jgi:hypothetical protein
LRRRNHWAYSLTLYIFQVHCYGSMNKSLIAIVVTGPAIAAILMAHPVSHPQIPQIEGSVKQARDVVQAVYTVLEFWHNSVGRRQVLYLRFLVA